MHQFQCADQYPHSSIPPRYSPPSTSQAKELSSNAAGLLRRSPIQRLQTASLMQTLTFPISSSKILSLLTYCDLATKFDCLMLISGGQMEIEGVKSLEEALAKTESEADLALKAATAAVGSIKKFRTAAKTGNLAELRKTIAATEEAVASLSQQVAKAKTSWDFNEDLYLSSDAFSIEILKVAEQTDVRIFQ
jgi:hypothetical protein